MIKCPEDVYELTKTYRTKKQEHFIVITLNGAHDVIKRHVITIGMVNRTIVHPREVFIKAIKDYAVSIMLVHNHPSGNAVPSPEDVDITRRLKEAGKIIGIDVLDHIIITKKCYYSFVENGVF